MLLWSILFAAALVTAEGASRIAGGEVTDITKYPFAAAILRRQGTTEVFQQACGGSILTARAILSSASCFSTGATVDVSLWRTRVGSTSSQAGGLTYFTNRITVHLEFNAATYVNDLAVVRPTVGLVWSSSVQPAPIAAVTFPIVDRQEIWAIGWGATSSTSGNSVQLQEVQMFVADHSICVSRYAAIGFQVTQNMVCAGWLDVGHTAQCEGDNGSPLVVDGVVVGVKSRSEECPDPQFPAVNTRVGPYARWIVDAATDNLN